MVELINQIAVAFNECQTCTSGHKKRAKDLARFRDSRDGSKDSAKWEEAFFHDFIKNLNVVLAMKKNDDSCNKLMKFLSNFLASSYEAGIFVF